MKLTEQQLAQLFKQNNSHNAELNIDTNIDGFLNSSDASDQRIKAVEEIANSNQLSASFQVLNQLKQWTGFISKDINSNLNKTNFSTSIFNWLKLGLKPALATAAIATGVYLIIPNYSPVVNSTQAKPDQTMFSGSFEKGKQLILPKKTKPSAKSDIIYTGNFG